MDIKRLRVLVIGIFKTVNNLNLNYAKDIFTQKLHPKVRSNDILAKNIQCKKRPKNISS